MCLEDTQVDLPVGLLSIVSPTFEVSTYVLSYKIR